MSTYQIALRERRNEGEQPDPTPIHIPGQEKPLSLREEMRRYIREQISAAAPQVIPEAGTFEEEDDFEEDDDAYDILSKYTVLDLAPEQTTAVETLDGQPDPQPIQEPANPSSPEDPSVNPSPGSVQE